MLIALFVVVAVVVAAVAVHFHRTPRYTPPERVEPQHGAPLYQNRYEPPELVDAIQRTLNERAANGGQWPEGVDVDTQILIEHQLARLERDGGDHG